MGFIPGATARYGDLLDALRSRYTPRPVDEPLPDRFVLIPAQLDFDTSFLFSPRFRTTDSFIGFVRHELPDAAIVVKNHPLQPDAPRTEPVYKGSANWNDLAARATLIAGLNSTTLPESLVQHRTVTAYADGPSRLGYAYGPLPDIWAQACEGKQQVSPEWMDYAVLALALNQFPADDPPSWVAEKILEERYVPNMLASF